MRVTGKAQEVARKIIGAFERGTVPEALSVVLLPRRTDIPAARWSWPNRFILALNDCVDARGFRQWKKVGRSVKKGAKAIYIVGPITYPAREDDPERGIKKGDRIVTGFKAIPVFAVDQTEGAPIPGDPHFEVIDELPLIDLARAWDISVRVIDSELRSCRGLFRPGRIGLAVENLSTWAHELIHAAEHRLRGGLKPGEHADQEIVAQFGASVLLECLGYERESDRGLTWRYIRRYAGDDERKALRMSMELIDRTCTAVDFILNEARRLEQQRAA
ncbi:MAG: hypothetical protein D6696_06360 [Acidobacteria bacterium]|nr:MAG: hypothetical protein D6696_06360 [Acidobacteriota bacterium]